ncbi:MAG: hypothetical protein ABJN39_07975 [Sulfitobacter sp.]|uniref:hypothetical protein n=1 Tax=Sulfitobacter sp. TaxID=1903071 RepID=UPI00329724FC
MTNTNDISSPQVSALQLFQSLAPTAAEALAQQLHGAGVCNSNDLVDALATGLSAYARARGIFLSSEFQLAWPGALHVLKGRHTEDDWERLLPQEATAPKASSNQIVQGSAQMLRVLDAAESVGMQPRTAIWYGIWIVTAAVIGHSGPLDADISLEELAECV